MRLTIEHRTHYAYEPPAVQLTLRLKLFAPQTQGQPWNGPIQFGQGTMAEHMVQVGYNAQHKVPWHWPVPAYLVTKGIGAGIFMVLALGWLFDLFPFDERAGAVGHLLGKGAAATFGFLDHFLESCSAGLLFGENV